VLRDQTGNRRYILQQDIPIIYRHDSNNIEDFRETPVPNVQASVLVIDTYYHVALFCSLRLMMLCFIYSHLIRKIRGPLPVIAPTATVAPYSMIMAYRIRKSY